MLKKIVWEDDAIFCIKLREDLFSLVQMRKNQIIEFFDIKNFENKWENINLNLEKSLFFLYVAENNLKNIFVQKIEHSFIKPSKHPIAKYMLSAVLGNNGDHGANLVELTPEYESYGAKIVKEKLTIEYDIEILYQFELAGMVGSTEKLTKRLVRYFDTGVNWDDSKKFLFQGIQPPPPHWVPGKSNIEGKI